MWEANEGLCPQAVLEGLIEMRGLRQGFDCGAAPVWCVLTSQMDGTVDATGSLSKVTMFSFEYIHMYFDGCDSTIFYPWIGITRQ